MFKKIVGLVLLFGLAYAVVATLVLFTAVMIKSPESAYRGKVPMEYGNHLEILPYKRDHKIKPEPLRGHSGLNLPWERTA